MKLNTKHPLYVMFYAAVVSMAFTGAIMSMHAATQWIVERNERLARQRAVIEALNLHEGRQLTDDQVADLFRRHVEPVGPKLVDPETGVVFNDGDPDTEATTYAAYREDPDAGRSLMGYALPIGGVGFWAQIDGLLAVTPDTRKVLGIYFLRHQETPGLGGRITEEKWRDQFRGLTIPPQPIRDSRYILIGGEAASSGEERYSVDAITGATGTSTAVEAFLNLRIARFRRAASDARLIDMPDPNDARPDTDSE